MEKIKKHLKTYWITMWLILMIVSVLSFVGYTEYIENQNRIKRVAANVAELGKLFTSDYLHSSSASPYLVQFPANVTACVIPVHIRNYDNADSASFFTHELGYSVTMQLVKESGALITPEDLDGYTVQVQKSTESDYTIFSQTASSSEITITETDGTTYTYTKTVSYDATNGYQITYNDLKFDDGARFEHEFNLYFQKESLKKKNSCTLTSTGHTKPSRPKGSLKNIEHCAD